MFISTQLALSALILYYGRWSPGTERLDIHKSWHILQNSWLRCCHFNTQGEFFQVARQKCFLKCQQHIAEDSYWTKVNDQCVMNTWAILEVSQRIIQKKSESGSQTLRCLIFFQNFILIWKCQKWSLNRGTLVSATAIYQTKCPFAVLSALFLFFRTLPYDSRLFPAVLPRQRDVLLYLLTKRKENAGLHGTNHNRKCTMDVALHWIYCNVYLLSINGIALRLDAIYNE